jgi:hypothetical protein
LPLVLKGKWYDKIASGEKRAEYRLPTDYWRKRLHNWDCRLTIVTGVTWNTSSHQIEVATSTATFTNGLCTAWTDNTAGDIDTTGISTIIGS